MSPNGGPPQGGAQQGAFVAGAPGNGLGAAPGLNPAQIQQQLAQRRSMAGGPPMAGGPGGAPGAGFPATQGMPQRPPIAPPQGSAPPPGAGAGAPPPAGPPMPPGPPAGAGQMGPMQGGPPPGMGGPQGQPNPQQMAQLAAMQQARGATPAPVAGMARGGRVKGGFKAGPAENIPEPKKKVAAVKRRAPPPPPPQEPPDIPPPDASASAGPPPMGAPPPGMKKGGKWIQTLKKGTLHKQLGIAQDKKIPEKTLEKAATKGGKLGKRARAAETLKKLRKSKGGACEKMAAGGAMKVRRGFPNVKPAPKKFAQGGKIRGCGAATKGTRFQGIF